MSVTFLESTWMENTHDRVWQTAKLRQFLVIFHFVVVYDTIAQNSIHLFLHINWYASNVILAYKVFLENYLLLGR